MHSISSAVSCCSMLLMSFTFYAGVDMDWIVPPPAEVKAEEPFNVTYDLILSEPFYDWAVISISKTNFFAHLLIT